MRNNWQAQVSEDDAHRRAAGRRKYNAVRQFRARVRRQEVLRLLGEFGWGYGGFAQKSRDFDDLLGKWLFCLKIGE